METNISYIYMLVYRIINWSDNADISLFITTDT